MLPPREQAWERLIAERWDLLVVGGGITGAGVLREAVRHGLSCALIEQRDFAWGTSSRSSKLVHGGLRYLATGQVGLTLESVREREALRRAAPLLVSQLPFLMPSYRGDKPPAWVMGMGLAVYDLLGQRWQHERLGRAETRRRCPMLRMRHLAGGLSFADAQTDDARLVLRVLAEAATEGANPVSYCRAEGLMGGRGAPVEGVRVRDVVGGREAEVRARVIISATGVWADQLRGQLGHEPELRPLRGSHLVFPAHRLPVGQAVSVLHPQDQRPVFALPWEGVTLLGTTDLDHTYDLQEEPHISAGEVDYLLQAARYAFPGQDLGPRDVRATLAGVRPVVDPSGALDPSKASREHVLHDDHGLITLTGGKLTTFRSMGMAALKLAATHLSEVKLRWRPPLREPVVLAELVDRVGPATAPRLIARYGHLVHERARDARAEDLEPIDEQGPALWGELRWAAEHEAIVHLEDLLLRRVRLGLTSEQGGLPLLPRIRAEVQPVLGWTDARWQEEEAAYRGLWEGSYSLPG